MIGGPIGATVAVHFPDAAAVPLALGLGVISHHALDLLPHTDVGTIYPEDGPAPPQPVCWLVFAETLIGLVLTAFLFLAHYPSWAFLLGAAGGMVPDLLDNIPLWQKRLRQTRFGAGFHRLHMLLHCPDLRERWVVGIGVDAVVVGGGLWYLVA